MSEMGTALWTPPADVRARTRLGHFMDWLAEHRHRFGAKRMILTHLGREVLAHRNDIAIDLAADGLVVEV